MNLKAFPPESVLENVDKINISFFSQCALETRQQLNRVALKRFFDDILSFLPLCGEKFAFIDKGSVIVENADLGCVVTKFTERMHEQYSPSNLTLNIGFDNQSDITEVLQRLCQEFEIDNLNYQYIGSKIKILLENILKPVFREYSENAGCSSASINEFLEDQIKVIQTQCFRTNIHKLRNYSKSLENLIGGPTKQTFDDLRKTTIDNNFEKIIEGRLDKLHTELDILQSTFRDLPKHNRSELIELQLSNIEKLMNDIPTSICQPIRSIDSPNVAELKEKKLMACIKDDNDIARKQQLSFLPFFRVKEVTVPSQCENQKSTPLNLNLITRATQLQERSKINSISYHICDLQNKTLSFSEELSQEESIEKISDDWLEKKPSKSQKSDPAHPLTKIKEKNTKSFSNSVKLIEVDPFSAQQHNINYASANAKSEFVSYKLLIALLEPFNSDIEELLNDEGRSVEETLTTFFESLYQRFQHFETENDEMTHTIKFLKQSETLDKELISDLESKCTQQQSEIESHIETIKSLSIEAIELRSQVSSSSAHIESLSSSVEGVKSQMQSLKSETTNKLAHLVENVKEKYRAILLADSDKRLITEIQELYLKVRSKHHNKIISLTKNKNKEISVLEQQTSQQKETIEAYQKKFANIKTKLLSLFSNMESADTDAVTGIKAAGDRVLGLKHKVDELRKFYIQIRKSNELITLDKNDLSFMNSNLIKELGVLSDTVTKLTNEKEKLEEQLAKESELKEKNNHLKLKISVLKEKLDLASSLKEMAEKNLESAMEDRNNPFSSQSKNFLSAPFDSIQQRYLRTIDENEELNEGTDIQEGVSPLKDSLSINTKEHNLAIENYVMSHKVFDLQISLPNNYLLIHSNLFTEPNQDNVITEAKKSSYDLKLTPITQSTQAKDSKTSNVSLVDNKNFDKFISLDQEILTENNSLIENKGSIEMKNNEENHSHIANESKLSQKKNLFSMQHVLKNLNNPLKPSVSSSVTSKDTIEFRITEDHHEVELKEKKEESDPNTAHDECRTPINYPDGYDLKDFHKDQPLFISVGSNEAVKLTHQSQEHKGSKLNISASKNRITKQLDNINRLSKIVQTLEGSLATKLTGFRNKLESSVKYLKVDDVKPLDTYCIDSNGQNCYEFHNDTVMVQSVENQNPIITLNSLGSIKIDNKSKESVQIEIMKNNIWYKKEESFENGNHQNPNYSQQSFEEAKAVIQDLKNQISSMNEQLETTVGLNTEYEAILDYTYQYLSEFVPVPDNKEQTDNQLNIQELLEAVSLEFISMQNRIIELNQLLEDNKVDDRTLQTNFANTRTLKTENNYISEQNEQSANNKVPEPKEQSFEEEMESQSLTNSDGMDYTTPSKQHIKQIKQDDAEENELRSEDAPEVINNQESFKEEPNEPIVEEDTSDNNVNQLKYNFHDFKEKQAILKEGFHDLLTNILYIIEDNFELVAETGTHIDEYANCNSKDPSNSDSSFKVLQNELMNCVEKIYQNNNNLKEMTEFLSSNLMKFISENESFKDQMYSSFPQTEQIKDLTQENDFLYHKLNESNKQIDVLMYRIQKYEDQFPEISKSVSHIHKRTHSTPNAPIINDQSKEADKSGVDIHEKIKVFLNKLYKKNIELPIPLPREEQLRMCIDSARNITNLGREKEFIASEGDAEQGQNIENKLEILENYNMFLLNIMKQVKMLIDDNGTPIKIRMNQLTEISKDLDAMYSK